MNPENCEQSDERFLQPESESIPARTNDSLSHKYANRDDAFDEEQEWREAKRKKELQEDRFLKALLRTFLAALLCWCAMDIAHCTNACSWPEQNAEVQPVLDSGTQMQSYKKGRQQAHLRTYKY